MVDPLPPHTVWDWLDSLWGFALGVILAVLGMLGWVNRKFKTFNEETRERLDTLTSKVEIEHKELRRDMATEVSSLYKRIADMDRLVVDLTATQREAMRTYQRLERYMQTLASEASDQTRMLGELKGRLDAQD